MIIMIDKREKVKDFLKKCKRLQNGKETYESVNEKEGGAWRISI